MTGVRQQVVAETAQVGRLPVVDPADATQPTRTSSARRRSGRGRSVRCDVCGTRDDQAVEGGQGLDDRGSVVARRRARAGTGRRRCTRPAGASRPSAARCGLVLEAGCRARAGRTAVWGTGTTVPVVEHDRRLVGDVPAAGAQGAGPGWSCRCRPVPRRPPPRRWSGRPGRRRGASGTRRPARRLPTSVIRWVRTCSRSARSGRATTPAASASCHTGGVVVEQCVDEDLGPCAGRRPAVLPQRRSAGPSTSSARSPGHPHLDVHPEGVEDRRHGRRLLPLGRGTDA